MTSTPPREDCAVAFIQIPKSRGGKAKRKCGFSSDEDDSSREPNPHPEDWWPCNHRGDCCAACQAPGDWPKHLDITEPSKSKDGSYMDWSGRPSWEQKNLCKECRDSQHCECSYCWEKRMPRDEPARNSWTSVSPEGVPTVHIPFLESDFQAERCAGCRLIRPREPHTPQDRKVCCDCSTHYCSLRCLEKDFARHRPERGCSANKGRDVLTYFKQMERALGEQKVLEAKAELFEAKEGYSTARVVLAQAQQELAAALFTQHRRDENEKEQKKQKAEDKWKETRASFEEHMDDAIAICAEMRKGTEHDNTEAEAAEMTRI